MTTPNYSGSSPSISGTQGKISTLSGDDQDTVVAHLKAQQGLDGGSGAPPWWSGLQDFGSKVWGAINGLGAIISGIGGTIATDVSDTILTISHLVNNATSDLTALVTNLSTAAQTVIGDISGVIADEVHTLQNIWDALGSGLGGGSSGHTAATLNARAIELSQRAQDAEAAALAVQWQLQTQQSSGGGTATGMVAEMDIAGVDGAGLPSADWPTVSGLDVRVSSGAPMMGTVAGTAGGVTCYANCAHLYTTDTQSISVVLGSQGYSAPTATILHFHCNSGYTAGIYLAITTDGLSLGSFTGAVGSRTYTPFGGAATISRAMSSGMRVEVRNAAMHTYEIVVNGTVQVTFVDSGHAAAAGNYYSQITMKTITVTYNAGWPWQTTGISNSFWLSAILVADYIIPTYVGFGAQIYRTSTSTVSTGTGSTLISGGSFASFFSAVGKCTSDITCDLTGNKLTVSVEGWYLVGLRSAAGTTSGTASALLYVNGSLAQWGSTGTFVGGPPGIFGFWIVYLRAGDYVQPGCNFSASSTLTGEATGTQTFFDIALLTKAAA